MPGDAILEESAADAHMPEWDENDLGWEARDGVFTASVASGFVAGR